jgi:arsenite methyltransferase
MEAVNNVTCIVNRPGGFVITDRAISFCSFPSDAKILDLGCGFGATVDHLIKKYGLEAFGLEPNEEPSNPNILKASAEQIPFQNATFDGVLMECSFSVVENQETALKECHRVLKTDGRLIISDMYARGEAALLEGCLGRVDTKEDIVSRLESNGYAIDLFEDFSDHLKAMWGQMIFDKGAKSFYCELGVTPEVMKQINCGYFLIVATKNEQR